MGGDGAVATGSNLGGKAANWETSDWYILDILFHNERRGSVVVSTFTLHAGLSSTHGPGMGMFGVKISFVTRMITLI